MSTIAENIEITGTGSSLSGVGRLPDGRALFVEGALIGERCDVIIDKQQERCAFGRAGRILVPSPHRTPPACPLYGECGGCAAMHMDYPFSLQLKARKVNDSLIRIGKLERPTLCAPIPAEPIYHYRNKAEYACRNGRFGAVSRGSNPQIVALENCLLQTPQSLDFLAQVRTLLHDDSALSGVVTRTNHLGELMGILCYAHGKSPRPLPQSLSGRVHSLHTCTLSPKPHHALDGQCRHISGAARLDEQLCGLSFSLSPHSFFQINRAQAETLVQVLLDALALRGDETVFDLYCGIGTLTLPLARRAKHVTGIEIVAPAIEDAIRAANENHIPNAHFLCGDAGKLLAHALKRGATPDVIVVDPPRKGLDPALIAQLLLCAPQKIAYVSCDCATLARDIRLLTESGRYTLAHATPLDMFPWTEHIETICLLQRMDA